MRAASMKTNLFSLSNGSFQALSYASLRLTSRALSVPIKPVLAGLFVYEPRQGGRSFCPGPFWLISCTILGLGTYAHAEGADGREYEGADPELPAVSGQLMKIPASEKSMLYTSSDDEFDQSFLNQLKKSEILGSGTSTSRYSLDGRTINMLINGNSVNFNEKAVHGYFIQGVLASLMASAIKICTEFTRKDKLLEKDSEGLIDFNQLSPDGVKPISDDPKDTSERLQGLIAHLLMNAKFYRPFLEVAPPETNPRGYIKRPDELSKLLGVVNGSTKQIWNLYGPKNSGKTKLLADIARLKRNAFQVIYYSDGGDYNTIMKDIHSKIQSKLSDRSTMLNGTVQAHSLSRSIFYDPDTDVRGEVRARRFLNTTTEPILLLLDSPDATVVEAAKEIIARNPQVKCIISTRERVLEQASAQKLDPFPTSRLVEYLFEKSIEHNFAGDLGQETRQERKERTIQVITEFFEQLNAATSIPQSKVMELLAGHCERNKINPLVLIKEYGAFKSLDQLFDQLLQDCLHGDNLAVYRALLDLAPEEVSRGELMGKTGLTSDRLSEALKYLRDLGLTTKIVSRKESYLINEEKMCWGLSEMDVRDFRSTAAKFERKGRLMGAVKVREELVRREKSDSSRSEMAILDRWDNRARLAEIYYGIGQLAKASEVLSPVLQDGLEKSESKMTQELYVQFALVSALEGQVKLGLKKTSEAMGAFERSLDLFFEHGLSELALDSRCDKSFDKGAAELVRAGSEDQKTKVREILDQVIEKWPGDKQPQRLAKKYLMKAVLLKNQGAYGEAFGSLDKASACLDKRDDMESRVIGLQVLNNKGVLLKRAGRFEEALANYQKVLEEVSCLSGGYTETLPMNIRMNKGVILRNLGRYEDAMKEYQDALLEGVGFDTHSVHANLAVLYADQGDYENALSSLSLARKMHGSDSRLDVVEARIYIDQKNYERADVCIKGVSASLEDPLFKSVCLTLEAKIARHNADLSLARASIKKAYELIDGDELSDGRDLTIEQKETVELYRELHPALGSSPDSLFGCRDAAQYEGDASSEFHRGPPSP